LSSELDSLTYQVEPQWDANLAKAYAKYFSSEELASLATEEGNSRYSAKLLAQQNVVGQEMQSLSRQILITYLSHALSNVFSSLARK